VTNLSISAVKVTLQNNRWEVAVRWDGLPFLVRHGTGDSIEEAVMNALRQVVSDAQGELSQRTPEPKTVLDMRQMVRPGDEPLA
jgi:hypothetical protein